MYLRQVEIRNIKCFAELNLDFTGNQGKSSVKRWTAFLGENGTGKSTLLQAIGAVLAGPNAIRHLLPFPETWVRIGAKYGEIKAEIFPNEEDQLIQDMAKHSSYTARYTVYDSESLNYPGIHFDLHPSGSSESYDILGQIPYVEKTQGWLTCGYGPFRRLSGGNETSKKIIDTGRKSARLVTLFYESAALANIEDWLKELYNTARDGDVHNRQRLELVKHAFMEKLLPFPAELLVDARQARLKIIGQEPISFNELSDGYRSVLALGVDLIRWLTEAFPDADDPMACPGIVLIDELDAHLHPKWQRQIGFWLLDKFPGLQFIVATHSPFLAQVASEQGGNILLERTPEGIKAHSDLAAVDTWRADQILREIFKLESSRSPEVIQGIQEFQNLHLKFRQASLSEQERKNYQQLRKWVENLPVIQDPEERRLAENYRGAVDRYKDELKEALK